jgi:hypothetical protein
MTRKIRSLAAALAVLAVLSAGTVQARPLGPDPAPAGFLADLWHWVTSSLASLWEKEGCEMDPDGLTVHAPAPPPTTDAGSDMDPDG